VRLIAGLVPMQTRAGKQQIIELTLAAPAPKQAAVQQAAAVPPPLPVQTSEDDITDKRIKPPEKVETPKPPEIKPEAKEAPASAAPAGDSATGAAEGTAAGTADGNGSGNNDGQGQGNAGGDSEVPVQRPYITYSYKPDYPRAARNRGVEGTVYVRVLVDARGRAESVELHESSGNDALDNSALNAVEDWRFSPARNSQDKAIPCYVVVPVSFVLN